MLTFNYHNAHNIITVIFVFCELVPERNERKTGVVQMIILSSLCELISLLNSSLKSQVVLLQTAHSWANAGVLLGARMHRERVAFETIKVSG